MPMQRFGQLVVERGGQAKEPRIGIVSAYDVGRGSNAGHYRGIERVVDPSSHAPMISLRGVLNIEVDEVVGLLLHLIARIEEKAAVVIKRARGRDISDAGRNYPLQLCRGSKKRRVLRTISGGIHRF